jgi:hypothetical protein
MTVTFNAITRNTLENLNQNYRLPGVMPCPVPPGRGGAANPQDHNFAVADEFIKVISFVSATLSERRLYVRQYQVLKQNPLFEPEFTERGSGAPWTSGTTTPAGEELDIVGSRFKKLSIEVRTDELMVGEIDDVWVETDWGDDVLKVHIELAKTSFVRALGEAVLFSNPVTDDDSVLGELPFYLPAGSASDVSFDQAWSVIGGLAELEARTSPSDGNYGCQADASVVSSRVSWRLFKEFVE